MGNWYILHVRTGQEKKIKRLIESQVNRGEKKVTQIIIPEEEVIEKGKEDKKVSRRFWPGYMLIEVNPEYDNEILWHKIRTTSGVLHFLGAGEKPVPLKDPDRVLLEVEKRKSRPAPKIEFNVGDKVEIIDGPFKNIIGVVEEVYPEKQRIKVSVSVFGRSTPLELGYEQVEKI